MGVVLIYVMDLLILIFKENMQGYHILEAFSVMCAAEQCLPNDNIKVVKFVSKNK